MNVDEVIKTARWVDLVYKSCFKLAFEYKGWEDLMNKMKHKRGRRPLGFRFYTKDGIYTFYLDNTKL